MSEDDRGFVIKDRRKLGEEEKAGEKKEGPEEAGESKPQQPPAEGEGGSGGESRTQADTGEKQRLAQLPEVTFSTFIWSLFSSSLVHLGEAPDPTSGQTRKDLALAKHTIDMIAMLQEKTKGNLTTDEQQMVDYILYEMRMKYLKVKG